MKMMRTLLCMLLLLGSVIACSAQAAYTTNYTSYQSFIPLSTLNTCRYGQPSCWVPVAGVPNKTVASLAAAMDKTLWAVTTDGRAYQHTSGTNNWVDMSANKAGYIAQIAVANATTVYARTTLSHNLQYNFSTNQWVELANDNYPTGGALISKQIAVGSDGDLWVIGSDASNSCGNRMYHRNLANGTWLTSSYYGNQLGVVNQYEIVIQCTNKSVLIVNPSTSTSNTLSGAVAASLAAGQDGAIWLIGADAQSVFAVTDQFNPNDPNGEDAAGLLSCCYEVAGSMKQIARGGTDAMYGVGTNGNLYFYPEYTRQIVMTVQGITTCTGNFCGSGNMATHTGTVSARAAGNSVTSSNQQGTFWNSYLQVGTSDQTTPAFQGACLDGFVDASVDCNDSFVENASVLCPIMGTILSAGGTFLNDYYETAETWAKYIGTYSSCVYDPQGNLLRCKWNAQNWCNAATSPPDMPVTWVLDQPPVYNNVTYWLVRKVCVRLGVGHPWYCDPININDAIKIFDSSFAPGNCTHNP